MKILKPILVTFLVVVTVVNTYFLAMGYQAYTTAKAATVLHAKISSVKAAPTTIVSTKDKTVASDRTGEQISSSTYKYQEQSQSKINDPANQGVLYLATETTDNANFLLAGSTSIQSIGASLSSGWTAGVLSSDTVWLPASCASKPTYLIGGRYIFIDDGKEKPSSKYSSYLVFDVVSKKFRYFGGDSFTPTQGDKEHILSIQNENGSVVFYIDTSDTSGPLSGSSTFKHAAAYSPGYITRRVLNLDTLAYTDYKIPYTSPPNTPYYYIDAGTNFSAGNIVTLTPDGSSLDGKYYYPGIVANNVLSFKKTANSEFGYDHSSITTDATLDQQLTIKLPLLAAKFNATAANKTSRFDVSLQGTDKNLQYLIATQSWSPDFNLFDSPVIYDTSTHTVNPMVKTAVLPSYVQGNYVPLGVF